MEMDQRFVEYKNKHNSTCVPRKYKADPKLGRWVATQRRYCKDKDRIDRLSVIGFQWCFKKSRTTLQDGDAPETCCIEKETRHHFWFQ
mmetsp:Transcript_18467/g.37802  ORF Transcript_18467/g.37802 Transcript_18467/m.37802 type:complete len:88 (-) Transcript_18467:1383-1646(-)